MHLRLLQFSNPRYTRNLEDSYEKEHPNFLYPEFRCYNMECQTCAALKMAQLFTEACYKAQHRENSIEDAIGK